MTYEFDELDIYTPRIISGNYLSSRFLRTLDTLRILAHHSNYIYTEETLMKNDYLQHYGILGMKWGVRRYQNEDGTYTEAGLKRLAKQDTKWAKKNEKKLKKTASAAALNDPATKYAISEVNKQYPGKTKYRKDGKYRASYTNQINRIMAASMSEQVKDIRTPSGSVISFVAATGSTKLVDVYTAISDEGYDRSKLAKGINKEGKVSYKRKTSENYLGKLEYEEE